MLLYDNYYLKEKAYASTSAAWKRCHIFLLISASVLSITSCVLFHVLFAAFDMNCILNAKCIVLSTENSTENMYLQLNSTTYKIIDLPIDYIKSQWSSMNDCYAPLYNPILSVIFGIIWSTFFLMCSKGGKSVSGLEQSWRIVIPSAVFTFVYCIMCMVVSTNLTSGLDNFSTVFMNTTDIQSEKYVHGVRLIDTYVLVNIIISWLYTLCWILSFLLLVLRCVCKPDFQLMHIKIRLIQKARPENGIDNGNVYKSTSETRALSYADRPSTSTGIFENPNSIVVQVNIEPNNAKKVGFSEFDIDQSYLKGSPHMDNFTAIASRQ